MTTGQDHSCECNGCGHASHNESLSWYDLAEATRVLAKRVDELQCHCQRLISENATLQRQLAAALHTRKDQ